jgi:dienelactone hydrolase
VNIKQALRQGNIGGAAEMATQQAYNPTLRERLLAQKADLTQRLADVDSAIEALDKNPNFEEVLNVIGKVNY